jgi:hypothetical protein
MYRAPKVGLKFNVSEGMVGIDEGMQYVPEVELRL